MCSFIGCYYPVEKRAIRLMEEIVGMWVSIRGLSITGAWLEQYKQITKKNEALRNKKSKNQITSPQI